jgi:hypothetical protein
MMLKFAPACVVAVAFAAMLGLAGCSLLSNGYGGWYWQSPDQNPAPVTMNQNDTANQSHAKSVGPAARNPQG